MGGARIGGFPWRGTPKFMRRGNPKSIPWGLEWGGSRIWGCSWDGGVPEPLNPSGVGGLIWGSAGSLGWGLGMAEFGGALCPSAPPPHYPTPIPWGGLLQATGIKGDLEGGGHTQPPGSLGPPSNFIGGGQPDSWVPPFPTSNSGVPPGAAPYPKSFAPDGGAVARPLPGETRRPLRGA